jgi:cell wall assembly regulator SMI1
LLCRISEIEGEDEMNTIKRVLSMILIELGLLLLVPVSAMATQNKSSNFSKSYTLGSDTASNWLEVATAQIGKTKANLGYTEAWCADFVCDSARLTGMSDNIIPYNYASRGACTYLYNKMIDDCGAVRVTSCSKGDLVFYYCSSCGRYVHVGIVLDSTYSIEGNYGGKVTKVASSYTDSAGHTLKSGVVSRVYLRPNYPNVSSSSYVNLGDDFYAYIINTQTWKHVTPDLNGSNIAISSGDADSKVWHFERRSDGSYKISSIDGRCMEVHNYESSNGTNVELNNYSDNSAQHWFITGESGAYVLRAECGTNVLDMSGGCSEDGTNIQMWESNGTYSQKFQIWKKDTPSSGWVHSSGGTNYSTISFWWDAGENASCYDLKIWKGQVWDGEPYKVLWGLTSTECKINLPSGYYEGYVDYRNGYSLSKSQNNFSFTVENGQPVDRGDGLYVSIIINKNWHTIINDDDNVCLRDGAEDNRDIWKMEKQSDGSYVIRSVTDGKVLEVEGSKDENLANVRVGDYTGADNQKWYIYGPWSGEYYFKPKCSDRVLDVTGGENNLGDNLALYDLNYSGAQKFAIWENPVPGSTSLSCTSGDSYSKTIFQWGATSDTNGYNLRINKEGNNVKNVWNITDTSCSVKLPAGEYEAYIDSYNSYAYTKSNVVKFTVAEGKSGSQADIGTNFIAKIYALYHWIPVSYKDGAVQLDEEKEDELSQIWRFERQSDGSYVIHSGQTGGVLTVQNDSDTSGTLVTVESDTGRKSQRWFLYGDAETGYMLQPSGYKTALDVKGGENKAGDILNLWELNYTNAQIFSIETISDVNIGTPVVTVDVNPADLEKNISIIWKKCDNAIDYDVLIYDENGTEVLYRTTGVNGTTCNMNLPVGEYQVCVQAKNSNIGIKKNSEKVKFTAKKSLTCYTAELGQEIYEYDGTEKKPNLILKDSSGKMLSQTAYTVEYKNNRNAGTATVKAIGQGYYTESVTLNFEINKIPQTIVFGSESITMQDSKQYLFQIEAYGDLTYSVDSSDIAEVSSAGVLTAKKAGTVKVTVSAVGDQNHNPSERSISVKIIHDFDGSLVTVNATCENVGTRTYTCQGCGYTYTEELPALGHKWDDGVLTKKATCTENGEWTFSCETCGDTITEILDATGHSEDKEIRNKKDATCTANGYTGDTYCQSCGEIIEHGTIIPAAGHSPEQEVRGAKTATCTETGYTGDRYCQICGEKVETGNEISALGHSNEVETRNVIAASCTTEGYSGDTYCKTCGEKLSTGVSIQKSDYTWDAETVVKAATCTENGERKFTCISCGETKTEVLEATGHSKETTVQNAKEASCEEMGYTGDRYCQFCGEMVERGSVIAAAGHSAETEVRDSVTASCIQEGYTGDVYCKSCGKKLSAGTLIEKQDHTWDAGQVTRAATCTRTGKMIFTCVSCGETKTEEIAAAGHSKDVVIKDAEEATCTEPGYSGDQYCQTCGAFLEAGSEIAATGHSEKTEIKFAVEASCENEGYTGDTYCTSCGEKLSTGKVIPQLSHTWDDGKITKSPTCTKKGKKVFNCTSCGTTQTETLPANGHSTKTVIKNAIAATCTESGYTGDDCCKVCGTVIEYGETIAATGHNWNSGKVTKKPTASTDGIKTYACNSCKITKTEVEKATGLKKGTVIKDKKSNGVYKVTGDGTTVEFTKPINEKKTSVTIPSTITYQKISYTVTSIGTNAFKNNQYLKKVKIGDYVTSIGKNSFYNCSKLSSVTFGKRVSTIGAAAFAKCTALTKLTLPVSVASIGKQSFYGCKKLKTLTIQTKRLTSKTIGEKAFSGIYSKVTVQVPKASYASYKKLLRAKGIGNKAVYKKS